MREVWAYIIIGFVFLFYACDGNRAAVSKQEIEQTITSAKLDEAKSLSRSSRFTKEEILSVVENPNGIYNYEKKVDHFEYHIQYKPLEYIIAIEGINDSLSEELVQERLNQIGDFDYFTFKINVDDFNNEPLRYELNDPNDYYSRLAYVSGKMQNDIYLISGTDSIPCSIYHFERTFGVSPFLTVSLAFEKQTKNQDRVIVFNDNLFGNGRIQMQLPKEIFTYQPKLKL